MSEVVREQAASSPLHQPDDVIQRVFGFTGFRPLQRAVIDHVLAGQDALLLMPTGAGKSLCYQVPAVMLPGVTVVISPLIALMQDQVQSLRAKGVRAASLNSLNNSGQDSAIESQLRQGALDLLFVAPERLASRRLRDLLQLVQVNLFAIDEAHCVSQWGHDFRPEYLELASLAAQWPGVPRLALTATATPSTRQEILQRLQLADARVFVTDFDRPNLFYRVVDKADVRQQLLNFIQTHHPGQCGIVYTATRAKAQALAGWLQRHSINALPYHAGLEREQRFAHQTVFQQQPDAVMVATTAFGMGIDKPDVRFVAHVDMPRSLEHYYQETGRAGRDGLSATAWLAYGLNDVLQRSARLREAQASAAGHQRVAHAFDAMLDYAQSMSCRRVPLLAHFGQEAHSCGRCDNCQFDSQADSMWNATQASQMVLSTVYRLWRERGQRFGSGHIVDILRGRATARVLQQSHQTLSVFGVGAHLSVLAWRNVIRHLLATDLLVADDEGYNTLALTPQSVPVLRGQQEIWLRAIQQT